MQRALLLVRWGEEERVGASRGRLQSIAQIHQHGLVYRQVTDFSLIQDVPLGMLGIHIWPTTEILHTSNNQEAL